MTIALHRDLTTVARVSAAASGIPDGRGFSNENALPVDTGADGPTGAPWLRSTLVDGQTGAGSAIPNERADCTFGSFPLGARRYLRWVERFNQMPTTSLDRWQVVGPEIHGPNVSAFPQALLMLEVSPSKRRRINANAGRSSTRYKDIGAIEIGRSYAMELDVILAADGTGRVRVRRDGGAWVGWDGEASIAQAIAGSYWKEANYRNAQINGPMVYEITAMELFSLDADDEIPAWTPLDGIPEPPPAPPPSLGLTARFALPAPGAVVTADLDFDLVLTGNVASVQVGYNRPGTGRMVPVGGGHAIGSIDMVGVPAGTYWLWAIVTGADGTVVSPAAVSFTWAPVTTPPPDPPPVDPCTTEKAERDAAVAAMNQAIDAMAETQAQYDALQAKIDEARPAIAHAAAALE